MVTVAHAFVKTVIFVTGSFSGTKTMCQVYRHDKNTDKLVYIRPRTIPVYKQKLVHD